MVQGPTGGEWWNQTMSLTLKTRPFWLDRMCPHPPFTNTAFLWFFYSSSLSSFSLSHSSSLSSLLHLPLPHLLCSVSSSFLLSPSPLLLEIQRYSLVWYAQSIFQKLSCLFLDIKNNCTQIYLLEEPLPPWGEKLTGWLFYSHINQSVVCRQHIKVTSTISHWAIFPWTN